ncbi:hypothetical protein SteCoe_1584 [Stentor coeruleus]|uniref:Uncharacterized protein n=1 Tax=Stentor coeruleus TaxID=5963 RepID=A0A1R2D1G9_9CILI|nr:hypothetical protein SteCoe_1584 [Stentor coeruleus]
MKYILLLGLLTFAYAHAGHKHGKEGGHQHNHDNHLEHEHGNDGNGHNHGDFKGKDDKGSVYGHNHEDVGIKTEGTWLKGYFKALNEVVAINGPLAATTVSSLITTSASLMIFMFIWTIKKANLLTDEVLNTLTSFACGALLGDVFLHLLPSISSSRNSSLLILAGILTGLLILAGILVFYILDRILAHNHSHEVHQPEEKKSEGKNPKRKRQEEPKKEIHEHKHKESAFLLLLADLLHNITDGMAIGASYSINPALGISTTIAIFFHEIAHEVGDFIAFLKFGISLESSLYMNLATGIGSMIGGLVVVNYGTNEAVTSIILPVVVGNFLYVSLVSMLSSMRPYSKRTVIWEVIFFCVGVGMMILIEELE